MGGLLTRGTASRRLDEAYNLRGLNMVKPDQTIDDDPRTAGQSPHAQNSRIYAQETEPRTTISSRKGVSFYSIPIGEALDTQNTTTTGQTDLNVSYLNRSAQKFTAATTKRLTKVDLLLKTNTSSDVIIVAIYSDNAGNIGNRLAISSIRNQDLQSTYAYESARFVQAPLLTSGTSYWIVVYGQEESITNNYSLAKTSTGSNLQTSIDGGSTWVAATGSFNFKTYLSDDSPVLWQKRYVKNDGTKQTVFAVGGSNPGVYYVSNESTGATTLIQGGLSTQATRYRSAVVNGVLYVVNGYDAVIKWNGATVSRLTHDPINFPVPENIIVHKNRVFYYNKDNRTRVYFSNLAVDYDTISSVNFFYVPEPTSPDPITGWVVHLDQLVIFTRESKWVLIGDDLSSFRLGQAPGATHGAVSQEAIALIESRVYFWSIDGGPYIYDGGIDRSIGDNIQPLVAEVSLPEQIDSVGRAKEWRIYFRQLGDTTHQHMLLFDVTYREWFIDTETYTRSADVRSQEGNQLMEASSVVGAVYLGENEDAQMGAPIDWEYWTNYKKYSSGIAKDRVRTFRAIFQSPDSSYTVKVGKDADFDNDPNTKSVLLSATGILYDGGETYGSPTAFYGTGSRVAQPKVSLSGRANNTQYRFSKYGAYTRVFLYGYESIVKSGRPR